MESMPRVSSPQIFCARGECPGPILTLLRTTRAPSSHRFPKEIAAHWGETSALIGTFLAGGRG